MKNQAKAWLFDKRPSRPVLSAREVNFWKDNLSKLLKVGIELEYNLPELNGSCDRQNFMCECKAVFKAPKPIKDTSMCYEQCKRWNGGNCEIAKEYGCAGIHCAAFESPCPSCSKYDRGCDTCPELYDIRKDPKYIRTFVGNQLKPTRFVGEHGQDGIYKVCRDGSLTGDGGIEVATVGKRPTFFGVYGTLKKVIDLCLEHGAFTNERCSIHIHLLASYLTPGFNDGDRGGNYIVNEVSELDQPVPEIILANFHQLIRRYQPALIWMGAAGRDMSQLTRWEKFRVSVLPYSAVRYRMPKVRTECAAACYKAKYSLINYQPTQFNEAGDVKRLHLEARYLDGMLSPSIVAAHAMLIYGLMLKAVDISRHGVLRLTKDYMEKQYEMQNAICNGKGDWNSSRHSDTRNIDPYITQLAEQSRELIRLIKNTLLEQSPADSILRALADAPAALRLMAGEDWKQIEADIGPREIEESETSEVLSQLIDTAAITECDTSEEWIEEAATEIARSAGCDDDKNKLDKLVTEVRDCVTKSSLQGRLFWSSDIGGFAGV